MRKWVLLPMLLILLSAAAAEAGAPSGIRGETLDTTCYGPCMEPSPDPPRYSDEGLVVTVKTLPDRTRVAKLRPEDGTFRLEAPPGAYRVRARVKDECWSGQRRRVVVEDGGYTTVTLHVNNDCIL